MAIFWIVFEWADPLGIASATKKQSSILFERMVAPFYGFADRPARDRIAVVAVTDSTLKEFKATWPLPYGAHAQTLNRILAGGAKGVFVDILFNGERAGDSLEAFRYVLDEAKRRNVPIVFGRAGEDFEPHGVLKEAPHADVAWVSERFYPLHLPQEHGAQDGHGGQNGHGTGHGDAEPLGPRTAAMDMFHRMCIESNRLDGCPPGLDPQAFEHPLALRWGSHYDPQQSLISDTTPCRTFEAGLSARLLEAGEQMLRSLFGALNPVVGKDARQSCFYILTISAEQLGNHDVIELLKDRVVFYGTDMLAQHDLVRSAVFGSVAGVQAHAMAFDNLLTYGTRYFHEAPEIHLWHIPFSYAELVEFSLWMAMIVVTALMQRVEHHKKSRYSDALSRCAVAIIGAIVLGAIWAELSGPASAQARYLGSALILTGGAIAAWTIRHFHHLSARGAHETVLETILLVVSVTAVAFILNEACMRWDAANWLGFVLLYVATREIAEINESDGGLKGYFFRSHRKESRAGACGTKAEESTG